MRGFTLIELSIVLIIIGLLVGGVLVGRDLIESAKFQSQVSQLRDYDTAVRTFELKYGGLPGDIDNGVAFGIQSADGDGNGKIESADPNDIGTEAATFWEALYNADLVTGVDYDADEGDLRMFPTPLSQSVTMGAIYNYTLGAHYWAVGIYGLVSSGGQSYLIMSEAFGNAGTIFNSEQLARLDRMMDDGEPYSGNVFLAPAGELWYESASDGSGDMDDYFSGGDVTADADCVSNDGTFGAAGATYSLDTENADCPYVVLW